MRIGVHPLRSPVDPDKGHQLLHARRDGLARGFAVVDADGLCDLRADGHAGVQRGERVLEHHGKETPTQLLQLALAVGRDVHTVHENLAGDRRRIRQQPHDRAAERAFAAAALAHDGQHLAGPQRKADVPHGLYVAARRAVGHGQVFHFQQIRHNVPHRRQTQGASPLPVSAGFYLMNWDISQSSVHVSTFQKMPTPWWPMTVSASMPCRRLVATEFASM